MCLCSGTHRHGNLQVITTCNNHMAVVCCNGITLLTPINWVCVLGERELCVRPCVGKGFWPQRHTMTPSSFSLSLCHQINSHRCGGHEIHLKPPCHKGATCARACLCERVFHVCAGFYVVLENTPGSTMWTVRKCCRCTEWKKELKRSEEGRDLFFCALTNISSWSTSMYSLCDTPLQTPTTGGTRTPHSASQGNNCLTERKRKDWQNKILLVTRWWCIKWQ